MVNNFIILLDISAEVMVAMFLSIILYPVDSDCVGKIFYPELFMN